jgi:hypothetical protein
MPDEAPVTSAMDFLIFMGVPSGVVTSSVATTTSREPPDVGAHSSF